MMIFVKVPDYLEDNVLFATELGIILLRWMSGLSS